MTNGKLISLRAVADILLQNPLMKDLSWEFIVSNAVECMRIVGTPAMFVSKREVVEIKNMKGMLPVDMIRPEQVFKVGASGDLKAMRSSTDSLHNHLDSFQSATDNSSGDTYTMNNSRLFTNFNEGKVLIVYKSIATDEDCYPLIPDNAELLRAIRAYIKYQWFDILNDMDIVSDRKLHKAETDYSYYVGQAQSNMQMPSIDEMESLVNSITQILPSRKQHEQRFQFLGAQEFMKVQ